ncbi:MAG: hypothetical protein ACI9UN_000189 [Granulosicoccus sp.]|jgi:hypothetical protein
MKRNSLSGLEKILRNQAMFVAFFVLCLGFLYYALFRDHFFLSYIPGFLEHRLLLTQWMPIGFAIPWLPSFLHALATLLCVHALLPSNNTLSKTICRVAVVSSLIAFELLFGTVDKFDIIAILSL